MDYQFGHFPLCCKMISDTKQWHTKVKIKLLSEFKVILYNSLYFCYKKWPCNCASIGSFHSVQFSSVAQSCPTLCNPMNCSMPGFPVHHQLSEFTQTYISPSSRWCHPAISSSVVPFSCCPQSLPALGSFPMSQLFTWGGQSIGVSASTSLLPTNTQDWSPLEWTGWISLQSKGLSRVFSNIYCSLNY